MERDEIKEIIQQHQKKVKDAFRQEIEKLLKKIQQDPFFSISKPPIDFDFLAKMVATYGFSTLKRELNKMHLWLLADPRRRKKNYRRFIVNWMNNIDRPFLLKAKNENY